MYCNTIHLRTATCRRPNGLIRSVLGKCANGEFEGFGLAPLEAMAVGLPVVATRAGGISEVVDDGVTGSIADVGDVEGIASRLQDLIEKPLLARRMGAAGRRRAMKEFGIERVVPHYERIYERLARAASRTVSHA